MKLILSITKGVISALITQHFPKETLMPIIPHLIADQFGSHVGKYSSRIKITKTSQTLAQTPLLHLESLTIANTRVSISADAIRACKITEWLVNISSLTFSW